MEERESVDAGLRHIDFLDSEVAAVERLIAQQALEWPEIRRLMTVPGVNLICAASFIAAVGDVSRFFTGRKLVAYLGLDPKVRQSGEAPARSGRISKRGSAHARWALVEAAWSVVLQPGAPHALYDRTRARRGHGKAIVATARKLAVLFWCMLRRREDCAHQQPSLTKKKLRRLEITAAPRNTPTPRAESGAPTTLSARPSASSPARPRPPTNGSSRTNEPEPRQEGWARARHRSAHEIGPQTGQSRAADSKLPTSALRYVSHPRPPDKLTDRDTRDHPPRDPAIANTGHGAPPHPESGFEMHDRDRANVGGGT